MKKTNMVDCLFCFFALRKNSYFDLVKITASWNGHLKCMEILISNGGDINEKDNDGRLPFDIMSKENEIKIKEYIKKMEDEDPLLVKGVVEDF